MSISERLYFCSDIMVSKTAQSSAQLYLTLFRATEQTMNMLIEVQRECEEMCISEPESELRVISTTDRTEQEKTIANGIT